MSVTLLTHTTAAGSNGATTSAIDTTGATLLFIAAADFQQDLTVTDSKGNTWAKLPAASHYADVSSSYFARMYYCSNPTVGTGHTVSATAGSSFAGIVFAAFSGVPLSATNDILIGAGAGSTTTAQPGSATPAHDNELILAMLSFGSPGVVSIDSGFTIIDQLNDSGSNVGVALAYLNQGSAAALNPTWTGTFSSSHAASGMTSFQSSAPAPAGSFMPILLYGG